MDKPHQDFELDIEQHTRQPAYGNSDEWWQGPGWYYHAWFRPPPGESGESAIPIKSMLKIHPDDVLKIVKVIDDDRLSQAFQEARTSQHKALLAALERQRNVAAAATTAAHEIATALEQAL